MSNQIPLIYTGEVDIKYQIGNKFINFNFHNEGLPALQESFCRIMTGNYKSYCDIPKYLDLRVSTDSGATYNTLLTVNRLPLTGSSWYYNNTDYIAKFTGTITYDLLFSPVSSDSTNLYMLYLYTDSEYGTAKRDLARLTVTAESLSKIMPGINSIVEWSMKLSNPTT